MREQDSLSPAALGRLATQYATEGYPDSKSPYPLLTDIYALLIPTINIIMQDAMRKIESDEQAVQLATMLQSYSAIQSLIESTCQASINDYYHYLERQSDTVKQQNYHAFRKLSEMHTGITDPKVLVNRGIETGTIFMAHALAVIPQVADRQSRGSETSGTIALRSYPFIVEVAKTDLPLFVKLRKRIGGEEHVPLCPSELDIRDHRLSLRPDTLALVEAEHPGWLYTKRAGRPVHGCPALYSPAMRAMWNKYTSIGKRLYEGRK